MLSRRFGAAAFGACAALATAVVVACSQSYAEDTKPGEVADGGVEADTWVEPLVDGDVTGRADAQPLPAFTVLVSGLTELSGIAATETDVYFTERNLGNVSSVPIGGGVPSTIAAGAGSPGPIVVAGGFLFWGDTGAAKLIRRTLSDGTLVTATPTPGKNPRAIAATADRLVVAAIGGASVGEIQQYAFDFNPGTSVAGVANPFDVAVAGASIYWTESSGARIGMGTIGGVANQDLALGEMGCESIAANAAGVYWTRPDDGLVRMISTMTGAGATTLAAKELAPMSVTVDDMDVYWLTGDGLLRRKTLGQELPPATLAKGFSSTFIDKRVRAIALTSQYVVWITTDGRVLRTDR